MSNQEDQYAADLPACRSRQARLLAWMESENVDWVILTQMESIQWLTGARFGPLMHPVAAISSEGHTLLVAPQRSIGVPAAADQVVGYEAKWHSTMRNDQRQASATAMVEALPAAAKDGHIGVEFSSFGLGLSQQIGKQHTDVEPTLYQLRRHKDPDEMRMMRRAIDATRAMYQHARQAIEPGINELDLYTQLYHVATKTLGETPTYFGQDFQCNSRGGPPRDRRAEQGELYILDLGGGFRGYYSDNARTFTVGAPPTDQQQQAWEAVTQIFPMIEEKVRPGVSCRAMFEEAQAMLDRKLPWVFNHHLGHGVGLAPHEGPHLNPNWDDTFEVGDFFTVEPGLYHEHLRHGMRIEQNYLVTETGVDLLTDFPLEL